LRRQEDSRQAIFIDAVPQHFEALQPIPNLMLIGETSENHCARAVTALAFSDPPTPVFLVLTNYITEEYLVPLLRSAFGDYMACSHATDTSALVVVVPSSRGGMSLVCWPRVVLKGGLATENETKFLPRHTSESARSNFASHANRRSGLRFEIRIRLRKMF
jgi:hypothetical protein